MGSNEHCPCGGKLRPHYYAQMVCEECGEHDHDKVLTRRPRNLASLIMPPGSAAEVPCRPAFDADNLMSVIRMIQAGMSRTSVICALMNNDQMSRADAEGRYETAAILINRAALEPVNPAPAESAPRGCGIYGTPLCLD